MQSDSLLKKMNNLAFTHKIPIEAFIVVTERCHLRCQQCYLVENPRPELSTQEIKEVIQQLADAGTTFLTITGGEPLLRPDIYELIHMARSLGMLTVLFTTATSCNEVRVQKLVEAGLTRTSVSIYAADPAVHDEVTQIPGSLQKTIDGVRELRRAGIGVHLKFLQMTNNIGELSKARELAQELDAVFSVAFDLTVCHDRRRDPLELQVKEELLFQIHAELTLEDPDGLGKITPRPLSVGKPMCGAGHTRVVIGTDGEVYPCLDLNIPLGNVKETALNELWQADTTKSIRQLKRHVNPICKVCPDKEFCNFCPGQSLLDTGDPLSPNATTCMMARVRKRTYEAKQAGRLGEVAPPAASLPSSVTIPSTGCQQCSSGLQQKVETLLEQPPMFAPTVASDKTSLGKAQESRGS